MDPSRKRAREDSVISRVDDLATEVGVSALKITGGKPMTAVAALIMAATRTAAACGVPEADLVAIVQRQYPVAKAQADADPPFRDEDLGVDDVHKIGN